MVRGPDGIGRALRRTAYRVARVRKDIPDTMALDNLLSERTSVKLMYIPCNEVTKYTDYVKSLGVLPTLKGTIKLHQIISVVPKRIAYRDVSCFCRLHTEGILDCHCYQLTTFKFDVESRDNAALLEGKYEGAPSPVTPQIGPTPAQISGNYGAFVCGTN